MSRLRLLMSVGAVALLGMAGFALLLWYFTPAPGVTWENYRRLRPGMSARALRRCSENRTRYWNGGECGAAKKSKNSLSLLTQTTGYGAATSFPEISPLIRHICFAEITETGVGMRVSSTASTDGSPGDADPLSITRQVWSHYPPALSLLNCHQVAPVEAAVQTYGETRVLG